jgi:hypothetical protein
MGDPTGKTSPQVYARVAGALYLYIIIAGGFGESYRGNLIVSGDAAATARNIMAHELMWRVSLAAELVHLVCAVAVALLLYALLRPVSNNLALLASFFNLVSITIETVSRVSLFSVLFPLGGASYLSGIDPRQLQALAYLTLKSYDYGFAASLVFFACGLFFYGYLIFRSGYFPKFLGVGLVIACILYLINSFAVFVAPAFEEMIFPLIVLPAGFAELLFCLWLLVMGVNVSNWDDYARKSGQRFG